jgi:hypothetical protein
MIQTYAALLTKLMEEEKRRLDEDDIKHGVTIGKMYEGHFKKVVLKRALPEGVNLNITGGFISIPGPKGLKYSRQIDCMLVRTTEREIPYTDDYVCDIENVVAVFEIKKTLYGKDLKSAFEHSKSIRDLELEYLQSRKTYPMMALDTERVLSALAHTINIRFDTIETAEEILDGTELEILHNLLLESWGILRVVFGYNGYESEQSFREKLAEQISDVVVAGQASNGSGTNLYSPGSFPQLIVSGKYSLCKMNGLPYMAEEIDERWPFYASTNFNPLNILLEYLWMRLAREFDINYTEEPESAKKSNEIPEPTEDPEPVEAMRVFLLAWVERKVGTKVSWGFEHVPWTTAPKPTVQTK